MKKKKKKNGMTICLVLILLAGLSLVLYPSIANYWNSFHATRAIATYAEQTASMSKDEYKRVWDEAVAYNQQWRGDHFKLSPAEQKKYESLLDIGGTGIMGYIEIPTIHVNLPIYHGTDEAVLQIATGHLEWTSLPVGGEGTHCVLSGHRGLPSAKLFTNLDQLHEGDTFILHILDEIVAYEVDQIHIVKPENTEDLLIVDGQDYCTLVTCTPYGINTHRLLVRGHRVEAVDTSHVVSEAIIIEPLLVAPVLATPLLLGLLIFVLVRSGKKKKRKGETDHG